MTQASGDQTGAGYTARSQKSHLHQRELESLRARIDSLIFRCEGKIAEGEKLTNRLLDEPDHPRHHELGQKLREAEGWKRELLAYNARRASLQSEIEALAHPTPAQAAEGAERRAALAKLALARFQKDCLIDGALAKLRSLLQERSELSGEMRTAAMAIDFTLQYDSFDEHRFALLQASLPEEILSASERWKGWFFSEREQKTESFIVRVKLLTLAEALYKPNIYEQGQVIDLTEEEASGLLSAKGEDGPPIERAISATRAEPEVDTSG